MRKLKTIERDSSIELLRIISMSMILVWHFFRHASELYETSWLCRSFMLSFLFAGVNIFVMISGYFGIKVRLKGFLNLFSLALIYISLNQILCLLADIPLNYVDVLKSLLFPFTNGGYWYLAAYIGLYFTAPFLERGLKNMSLQEIRYAVLLFTIFNIVSCGILGNLCNPNGFTYMQFIFLYILGSWMKKDSFFELSTVKFIILAIFSGMAEFLLIAIIQCAFNHPSSYFLRYNNIFVILQAMCVVGVFIRIHLKSRFVNKVALASLECYLLQDGVFGYKVLYPFLKSHDDLLNYVKAFIGIWTASYIGVLIKKTFFDPAIYRISSIPYLQKFN